MKITEEFFLSSRREILEDRMFDEDYSCFLNIHWLQEDPSTSSLGINYGKYDDL